MSTAYVQYPVKGVPIFPTASAFPASAQQGSLAVAADTGALYEFNGTSWVLLATPSISPAAIDGLTGDVSASGPGIVAATVNSVGGSTAAQVHQSVLDTLAATELVIPHTLVKRDANSAVGVGCLNVGSQFQSFLEEVDGAIVLGTLSDPNAQLFIQAGVDSGPIPLQIGFSNSVGPTVYSTQFGMGLASPDLLVQTYGDGAGTSGGMYDALKLQFPSTNGTTNLLFLAGGSIGALGVNRPDAGYILQNLSVGASVMLNSALPTTGLIGAGDQDAIIAVMGAEPGGGNSALFAFLHNDDSYSVIESDSGAGAYGWSFAINTGGGEVNFLQILDTGPVVAGQGHFRDATFGGSAKALVSDTSKNITESAVTGTELGYVSGVTSSIQAQLNAKQRATAYAATATNYTTLTTDNIVGVTSTAAPRSITLVSAASVPSGTEQIIKDESGGATTNNITVVGNVDGASNPVITINYGVIRVYSNGSNWFSF